NHGKSALRLPGRLFACAFKLLHLVSVSAKLRREVPAPASAGEDRICFILGGGGGGVKTLRVPHTSLVLRNINAGNNSGNFGLQPSVGVSPWRRPPFEAVRLRTPLPSWSYRSWSRPDACSAHTRMSGNRSAQPYTPRTGETGAPCSESPAPPGGTVR